ncbi:site-specific DNA-methyltransferase [Helicobacter saguini]|uniref:Methyltransferase n=1 Tax=Helicobacter saguini TaxID=1548018 RepID=A0A347W7I9_9HELI|nr:site-specific DNA-methyltransferase [Helicobacter saguini]MWV61027.1 site-specific DNA-methyltransferase [Helicobacter saguini]MWV68304.1 site-specific DNA-methyltransferase [Helicobacter saguini]MWV70231.1 site-specific DNA-methyltransferase [Helicobacter saguini]MWV72134.1 site-specific DNA-methyltransferase [Helicobacter saguini]TLD91643.1 site-specific DNA-methyltransferase [Helicobacter saguini]
MCEMQDSSIHLIITSPPYFCIKDYSMGGFRNVNDVGSIKDYSIFIEKLLNVWKECYRILTPNGKLCINVPLLPIKKAQFKTHYNRHLFDLNADIQHSILTNIKGLYLLDLYVWNKTNSSKSLVFGSYPYPSNFYSQNTSEFIAIYVKDGKPRNIDSKTKEISKLTQKEWLEFTKKVWEINVPTRFDIAHGKHPAIMPSEIPYRLIKMFSFVGDNVLDCFCGSGTTLKVAKELNRNYVGYEIYPHFKDVIESKLGIKQKVLSLF